MGVVSKKYKIKELLILGSVVVSEMWSLRYKREAQEGIEERLNRSL
jgi:hypothetical protein